LTGSQFRSGTGLDIIDGLVKVTLGEYSESKNSDKAFAAGAKFLGNYLSSFTVGAGMMKDVYAQFDPAFANLPVNEDIEFWPFFFKQATRSLPIAEDGSDPFLYTPLSPRESMQSTTKTIPVRNANPILRQITGLSFEDRRNYAENELNRLQFDWVEVAPRKTLDPKFDNEAKELLGIHIENVLSNEVVTPDYQSLPDDTIKRKYLYTLVQAIKTDAVNLVTGKEKYDTPKEMEAKNRVRYYREIPSDIRKIMEKDYDKKAGKGSFVEDQDFAHMLHEYYKEGGYKKSLSKKELVDRYMRQLDLK